MFWTAFVWGLGVSSGACFGLLIFFVLKAGLDWVLNTQALKSIADYNERTLAALQDRNRMTETMIEHVAVIAKAHRQSQESE